METASQSEKNDFTAAVNALRARLDPASKTMAAQDFRHSLQRSGEGVPDFIRRLTREDLPGCLWERRPQPHH